MSNENKNDYLSNKELLSEWLECQKTGFVSERLGEMFLLLSTRYTNHRYFVRYPFKDDLIAAGALACCRSWARFDPKYSDTPNPFAFFSTVVYNAFVQYIKKEYGQTNIKNAMKVENGLEPDHGYTAMMEEKDETFTVQVDVDQENENETTENTDIFGIEETDEEDF